MLIGFRQLREWHADIDSAFLGAAKEIALALLPVLRLERLDRALREA
jgi:hypothetical protein